VLGVDAPLVPHVDVASPLEVGDAAPDPHDGEPVSDPLDPLEAPDDPHDDVAAVDSGADPHPAGSLAPDDGTSPVVSVPPVDPEVDDVGAHDVEALLDSSPDDVDSRRRYAVTSLPVGTIATTSQPSDDRSLSLVANEAAS